MDYILVAENKYTPLVLQILSLSTICLTLPHAVFIFLPIFSTLYSLIFFVIISFFLYPFFTSVHPSLNIAYNSFFIQIHPSSPILMYKFFLPLISTLPAFVIVTSSSSFFSFQPSQPCRTIRRSTWSTYTAGLTACAPRTKAPTSSSPPLPSI